MNRTRQSRFSKCICSGVTISFGWFRRTQHALVHETHSPSPNVFWGDQELAAAESKVVDERDRPQVLEKVAVGLAEAGRIQEALDLANQIAREHRTTLGLWEVAEVAARKGWPKMAARTIAAVYIPEK